MTDPRSAIMPLDQSALNDLINHGEGPCVSLYMPTERRGADTRKNGIRYKDLLKGAENELRASNPAAADQMLGDLRAIADDNNFWQHQLDGLAVFRAPGLFRIYRLGRPVKLKAAVADSFHVKPLIRILQNATRYQLLAVTQKNVTLYEGDMDNLDEVPLHPDVPNNIIEALGGEVRGELNVSHYGGMSYNGMFHGHHDNKDDRDVDLDRFFRVVDKAIYEYHGRGGDLPLYFAGVTEYHDRFFKASHHPRLVKEGPRINPDAVEVDPDRLRKEMEGLIRPRFEKEIDELVEQYGNARAKQQGSDELSKVGEAAVGGRVLTLLIDADKSVGGHLDPATGHVKKLNEGEASVDDVLDDIAEATIRTNGKVRVIPGDKHPSVTGVAAIFRY